jgi:hypothetical protein
MGECQTIALLIAALSLAGCTSDPNAPVNEIFPIRQKDSFFDSLSGPPAPPGLHTRTRLYAGVPVLLIAFLLILGRPLFLKRVEAFREIGGSAGFAL